MSNISRKKGLTMEALIILVLILLNGFFAMAEIAVVSSQKVRLKQLAREGTGRPGGPWNWPMLRPAFYPPSRSALP